MKPLLNVAFNFNLRRYTSGNEARMNTPGVAAGNWAWRVGPPGTAVQVDSIKPTLKAPGSKRLKLQYDELHSSIAFKFNLRRYNQGCSPVPAPRPRSWLGWRQLSTAWYGGAGGPYQTHVQSAWN
jgi:hypothetical protein